MIIFNTTWSYFDGDR